jgi:hypothetical protein
MVEFVGLGLEIGSDGEGEGRGRKDWRDSMVLLKRWCLEHVVWLCKYRVPIEAVIRFDQLELRRLAVDSYTCLLDMIS